jgi:hypothetical protein
VTHRSRPLLALLALVAACGGGTSAGSGSGSAGNAAVVGPDEVAIAGHVTAPGTKGALLVFAYAGEADPATAEPLSVAAVEADGGFAMTIPPVDASLTLTFLADGTNDGAIDGGDPVATLSAPALANLLGGVVVTLDDVGLDFTSKKARAGNIDVRHAGAAAQAPRTPTPVPSG